ncbi:MAG: B12-binding domain-containing radical SAM protein [Theionarchaea archaeon]|nr:B12-binding domain-containing radical SAM protein [Theionarchaea archaeon]
MTVVAGGVHPTLLPEQTLKECSSIDYVVCGEGEFVFPELLAHLESDTIDTLPNLAYRDGTRIKKNPIQYIPDLDALPFPDWSLFDYSLYYRLKTDEGEITLYQINSSRGCPYTCTFCSPLHGKKVRFRSAESLAEEIRLNYDTVKAQHFDFADSNATLNRKNFVRLCNLLIEEGLSDTVGWSIDTHANHVDRALLELAKKAGLRFMSIGVESGDQTMIHHIGKNITLSQIEDAIKTAANLGIRVKCSLLLGHPYETAETAEKTFQFALYLRRKYKIEYYYNLVDVYPDTNLFHMVEKGEGGSRWIQGKRNNWAAYRRDEPMIEVNDLNEEKLNSLYEKYAHFLDREKGSNFYEGG